MSNIAAKVTPGLGTKQEAAPGRAPAPPLGARRRERPYKAQMATKVKWALTDSLRKTEQAQRHMREILDWVHELRQLNSLDLRVLAHLGKLDHLVAYLALDIGDVERVVGRAINESRDEE